MSFDHIQAGDLVTRMLGGAPMQLRVESITEDRIICHGGWEFDRATGAEIDELLDWGPPPKRTGSYLLNTSESRRTQ